jgi:tRNA-dihydrouridine synthase
MLGIVDLVEKDADTVIFWTCDEEKSRVVFQIGTSDAVQAVQAANLVSAILGVVLHHWQNRRCTFVQT